MEILKRDGQLEEYHTDKIRRVIELAFLVLGRNRRPPIWNSWFWQQRRR